MKQNCHENSVTLVGASLLAMAVLHSSQCGLTSAQGGSVTEMILTQSYVDQILGCFGVSLIAAGIAFDMKDQAVLVRDQQDYTVQLIEEFGLKSIFSSFVSIFSQSLTSTGSGVHPTCLNFCCNSSRSNTACSNGKVSSIGDVVRVIALKSDHPIAPNLVAGNVNPCCLSSKVIMTGVLIQVELG
ncbi:hypothetical protein PSHI_27210 [Pseudomonas sp. URMO17WK12:I11]|nr:hypothetical protein PSHI_27210 [Pseudomonas sp. URMO17WK12:I11]